MNYQNNSTQEENLLIFIHIPKTGGTSLSLIASRQYKPGVFKMMQAAQEKPDDLRKILLEDRQGEIKAIATHLGFGLHEIIPRSSTHITMLREPVDRVISHYYHACRDKDNMSLEDFILNDLERSYNLQTRYLSGAEFNRKLANKSINYGDCTNQMLEAAKNNLIEYFNFGILEKFDESLILLNRDIRWKVKNLFYYTETNKSINRRQDNKKFSTTELKLIENYNEFDIELYRYAAEVFNHKINQLTTLSNLKLNSFLLINSFYRGLYKIFKSLTP